MKRETPEGTDTPTVPLRPQAAGAADGGGPGGSGPGRFGPGSAVGRYLLLQPLGAGGMGVVWTAFDPELDRKVALKLLHPRRGGAEDRLRLLREAQAAARLSHPNAVQVYDVGTAGGEVFVAMERVDGWTFDRWRAERKPGRRELVAAMTAAGRGLAAAHEAGLVHRDFKPGNVLIGRDGSVRVADFGLARAAAEGARPAGGEAAPEAGPGSLVETPMTGAGDVLGTPAYMAPEQYRGEPAGPAADQFSFCTTLYEALYGERPFAGRTLPEAFEAALAGRVRPAPAGNRVPGWLRQALLRGLAADPAARWPSMAALLAVLERDPEAARRRRLAAAAVLAAAVVAAFAAARWQARREALCAGGPEQVAAVWNDAVRASGEAAFAATGLPFAAGAWKQAAAELDRYAAEWAAEHRGACEATRRRGEQSAELLDRRMFCLEQRRAALGALAGVFAAADEVPDGVVVRRAPGAARALPPLAACADAAALLARVPPPTDPAVRGRVEAIGERVAAAQALADAGREAEALARLAGAAEDAAGAGYRPLEADALRLEGYLRDHAGEPEAAEELLFRALVAAENGGHGEAAVRSASDLAWVTGYRLARTAEAGRWARLAAARAEGMDAGPWLRARVLLNLGSVETRSGRYDEAAGLFRRADEVAAAGLGPDNPVSAAAIANLGSVLALLGRYDEALAAAERALAMRERLLEPNHPDLARSLNEVGNALLDLGRLEEAAETYRRSAAILREAYGEGHPEAAGVAGNLGIVLKELGRLDEAAAVFREALAAAEAADPGGLLHGVSLGNVGEVLGLQKRWAESLETYRRALVVDTGYLGDDHPDLAYALAGIGAAEVELERPAEAIPALERALALREAAGVEPALIAHTRFLLARALWDADAGRQRAAALAESAAAAYRDAGPRSTEELRRVSEWLADRRPRAAAG